MHHFYQEFLLQVYLPMLIGHLRLQLKSSLRIEPGRNWKQEFKFNHERVSGLLQQECLLFQVLIVLLSNQSY
jgi:hypothetical protein